MGSCGNFLTPHLAKVRRKFCDLCWVRGATPKRYGRRRDARAVPVGQRAVLDVQVWHNGLVTEFLSCGHILELGPRHQAGATCRTCPSCNVQTNQEASP